MCFVCSQNNVDKKKKVKPFICVFFVCLRSKIVQLKATKEMVQAHYDVCKFGDHEQFGMDRTVGASVKSIYSVSEVLKSV